LVGFAPILLRTAIRTISSGSPAAYRESLIAGGWLIVRAGYDITFYGFVALTAAAILLYLAYYKRHPLVRSGEIASALSNRERARRAIAQTERVVGTIDGSLPGTIGAEGAEAELVGGSRHA
jgi:hypothetical protein